MLALQKVLCKKQSPRIITNVIYKNFKSCVFREHLKLNLEKPITCQFILNYSRLFFFLTRVKKSTKLRANQASFMNTELQTAMIVISQLRNKYLKCRSERVKRH